MDKWNKCLAFCLLIFKISKLNIDLLRSFQEGVLALQELTDAFTEMHSSETWNPQALTERDLFYYFHVFTDCRVH